MSGRYTQQGTVDEVYDVTSLGQGLEIVRERVVDFSHKLACKFLEDFEDFPGDRKLKQSHVNTLVRAMTRGTFRWELVKIITCKLGDKVYRMNGQHTAWARLEIPEEERCKVAFTEYEAGSEEDLRMLYASIDRGSPRTKSNVIHSYLAGRNGFADLRTRTLRLVPQGFAVWFWPSAHERKKYDGDDIAYLIQTDHYNLALKVGKFLDEHSQRDLRHVMRAPVVASMFATFNKAPKVAETFWSPVIDGVGFEKRGDARLKLRTELMQTAVGLGSSAQSDKKKVTTEYMFRQCVAAWNAFRDGRSLQVIRAYDRGKRPRVK